MANEEEMKLAEALYMVGKRLGKEFQSRENEKNILHLLEQCLRQVKPSPSEIMELALAPAVNSLNQPYWLGHPDEETKLLISSCFMEIIRIVNPHLPYDVETTKIILNMIVECFQDLDETCSSLFSRRAAVLKTFSEVGACILLIEFEMENQIYHLFNYLFSSTWSEQEESMLAAVMNVLISTIKEADSLPESVQTLLLDAYKREEQISPTADLLVKEIFSQCEDKLKPFLKKTPVNKEEISEVEEEDESWNPFEDIAKVQGVSTDLHSSKHSVKECNVSVEALKTSEVLLFSTEENSELTCVKKPHVEDSKKKLLETKVETKMHEEAISVDPNEREVRLVEDMCSISNLLLHNSRECWCESQVKEEKKKEEDEVSFHFKVDLINSFESCVGDNMEGEVSSSYKADFSSPEIKLRKKAKELEGTMDGMMKSVHHMRDKLRSTTQTIFEIFIHQSCSTSSQPVYNDCSSSSHIADNGIQILSNLDRIHRHVEQMIYDVPRGEVVCCISIDDMKSIKFALEEIKSSLLHIFRDKDLVANIADKALEWHELTKTKLQEVHETLIEAENQISAVQYSWEQENRRRAEELQEILDEFDLIQETYDLECCPKRPKHSNSQAYQAFDNLFYEEGSSKVYVNPLFENDEEIASEITEEGDLSLSSSIGELIRELHEVESTAAPSATIQQELVTLETQRNEGILIVHQQRVDGFVDEGLIYFLMRMLVRLISDFSSSPSSLRVIDFRIVFDEGFIESFRQVISQDSRFDFFNEQRLVEYFLEFQEVALQMERVNQRIRVRAIISLRSGSSWLLVWDLGITWEEGNFKIDRPAYNIQSVVVTICLCVGKCLQLKISVWDLKYFLLKNGMHKKKVGWRDKCQKFCFMFAAPFFLCHCLFISDHTLVFWEENMIRSWFVVAWGLLLKVPPVWFMSSYAHFDKKFLCCSCCLSSWMLIFQKLDLKMIISDLLESWLFHFQASPPPIWIEFLSQMSKGMFQYGQSSSMGCSLMVDNEFCGTKSLITFWDSELLADLICQIETLDVRHVNISWSSLSEISLLQRKHCASSWIGMECGVLLLFWHWFRSMFENIFVADQNYDNKIWRSYRLIWDPGTNMFGALSFVDCDMLIHFEYSIVLIKVAQRIRGTVFLRKIWNPGITWVFYSTVEDDEANDGLLEFIPMMFHFNFNLVISCVGIQQCSAYINWCYPSPRMIWDPGILFGMVKIKLFLWSVMALLEDKQFWEGRTVMFPFWPYTLHLDLAYFRKSVG